MDIKVVIPTYKRAGRVSTLDVVSPCILCVAESEYDVYTEFYPDVEIVTHPDTIIGLASKRQWIYEYFKNVFMLDDDVTTFTRRYTGNRRKRFVGVSPEQAFAQIQWCGNTARLVGAYLFGFAKEPNPLLYKPFSPIKLSGFATGCAFGLLEGSQLEFSPKTVAVEDFYISGMNAYFHRKAFFDSRFNFVQKDTFKNVGGQAHYRTIETEAKDTLLLRELFGECLERKASFHGGGSMLSTNKNQYGRTLKIPF